MLPISAASYRPHALHGPDQSWPETNCYTDLWIELLHALECEPRAGLAFLLSTGFDGEQWQFFKYPPEDLRSLYGIEVGEMNIWRPIIDHIEEHLALGHLLTVEVDSYYLPDTAGTSYGTNHQKSTIVVNLLDRQARRIEYFHNAGFYELGEPEFSAVLRLDPLPPAALVPYVEVIDLTVLRRDRRDELLMRTRVLVADYLDRRPSRNPIDALGARVLADVPWLREKGIDVFHQYAFGTLRQCGAWAGVCESFVSWLAEADPLLDEGARGCLDASNAAFAELAEGAKRCQFLLARAAAGRNVDLGPSLADMAASYDAAMAPMLSTYASAPELRRASTG